MGSRARARGHACRAWRRAAGSGGAEATLDSFVPGAGVDTLAPLKLKAKGADKTLQGGVAWDGYKLAASVRTEQGRIRDASLKGALDNGLMGMILSAMEEKGFVPAAADNDGNLPCQVKQIFHSVCPYSSAEGLFFYGDFGKLLREVLFLLPVCLTLDRDLHGLR